MNEQKVLIEFKEANAKEASDKLKANLTKSIEEYKEMEKEVKKAEKAWNSIQDKKIENDED